MNDSNRKYSISVIQLFFIQIKSALLLLPGLCFFLIFCLLLSFGILTAGREYLSGGDFNRLPVALVLPEEDTYASLAFSYLERMESIRETCRFIRTDEENATKLLKSGKVYAVILIPDSFVEHILNGTNDAATLLLPQAGTLESILFATLADAGASTLGTAQAGIYAADTVLISHGRWEDIPKAEEGLNRLYLSYALNRDRIFSAKRLSFTDSMPFDGYYICSGIVLFLLLSSMGNYSYYCAESEGLLLLLNRQGISSALLLTIKLLAVSTVYTLLLFPLLAIGGIFSLSAAGGFFLLVFVIQSFFLLLSNLFSLSGGFVISSTLISMICLFLSGAFIPSVFLPDTIQQLGNFLPTALFLRLCRELYMDTFSILSAVKAGFIGIVLLFLTLLPRQYCFQSD